MSFSGLCCHSILVTGFLKWDLAKVSRKLGLNWLNSDSTSHSTTCSTRWALIHLVVHLAVQLAERTFSRPKTCQFFQNSASGCRRKKVRILTSERSQIVCRGFFCSAIRTSSGRLYNNSQDFFGVIDTSPACKTRFSILASGQMRSCEPILFLSLSLKVLR